MDSLPGTNRWTVDGGFVTVPRAVRIDGFGTFRMRGAGLPGDDIGQLLWRPSSVGGDWQSANATGLCTVAADAMSETRRRPASTMFM